MPGRVVAAVRDLFFVARFREVAARAGLTLQTATPETAAAAVAGTPPALVLVDLTVPGWDYARLFDDLAAAAPGAPVLGFTTHAAAAATRPLHARCRRVVTKDALTRQLPAILARGLEEARDDSLEAAARGAREGPA